MKETEVETLDIDIVEVEDEKSEVAAHKEMTVSALLQKNNELLEYHNDILRENKKIMTTSNFVNILFRLILIAAAVVFCYFLYMIYNEVVISNAKETTIVNNLPQQQAPMVNVSVPETNVAITNHAVLDKVSFYKGGYYGFVYKNTSQNLIYCRTKDSEAIHDAILSPNSILELTTEIVSCKDAVLIEIRDPSKPIDHKMPHHNLFKI